MFAARYNQNLPRWDGLEHRISYGLDYRAHKNDVTPVGGTFKLVPDIIPPRFYDQGLLRRNKVQPGELEQQSWATLSSSPARRLSP